MAHFKDIESKTALKRRIRSVAAAHTIDPLDDDVVLVDTTAASRTITLPALAEVYDAQRGTGKVFHVVKMIAANNVVIDGAAAETINGAATQTLTSQYSSVLLIAGPTEWSMMAGPVLDTASISDNAITNAKMADDAIDSAEIVDGAIDLVHMSADSIDSDQYVDGSIDTVHFAAGVVDTAALGTASVTAVKLDTARCRTVAEDGACTLAATDDAVALLGATVLSVGGVAVTMTATHNGHRVKLVLQAASGGGNYTAAASYAGAAGTVTMNAAGEGCELMRVGAVWLVLELTGGATFA